MKIGIIQASSQKDKNGLMVQCVHKALADKNYEIINFGVTKEETLSFSYVQIALCISLLLESKAVDFVITGCSSGQGMMLACNSLPGVLCGYIGTVTDAFLFGRINAGNVVSYPLGCNWAWAGEINFEQTIRALFAGPMGCGYPKEDAERKRYDMELLKGIHKKSKRKLTEILFDLDSSFIKHTLQYDKVYYYIMENGTNQELIQAMKQLR